MLGCSALHPRIIDSPVKPPSAYRRRHPPHPPGRVQDDQPDVSGERHRQRLPEPPAAGAGDGGGNGCRRRRGPRHHRLRNTWRRRRRRQLSFEQPSAWVGLAASTGGLGYRSRGRRPQGGQQQRVIGKFAEGARLGEEKREGGKWVHGSVVNLERDMTRKWQNCRC